MSGTLQRSYSEADACSDMVLCDVSLWQKRHACELTDKCKHGVTSGLNGTARNEVDERNASRTWREET